MQVYSPGPGGGGPKNGQKQDMLSDLINDLVAAKTAEEKERAYRNLEAVGMDRMTSDYVVRSMKKGETVCGKET